MTLFNSWVVPVLIVTCSHLLITGSLGLQCVCKYSTKPGTPKKDQSFINLFLEPAFASICKGEESCEVSPGSASWNAAKQADPEVSDSDDSSLIPVCSETSFSGFVAKSCGVVESTFDFAQNPVNKGFDVKVTYCDNKDYCNGN